MIDKINRDEAVEADPLMAVARRLCEFVNTNFEPRSPLIEDEITLRHIGELCWVLDIIPNYSLKPRENR